VPDPRKINFYSPSLERRHFAPRYWSTWFGLALMRVLALLPLFVTRSIGCVLGLLMYLGNAKRRRIARVNLQLCFPQQSVSERERLLRRHFCVYGQSFTDIAHLAWSSTSRLQRMMHWHGVERYRELLRQGRRVILLVPHWVGLNYSGAMLGREHATFCIIKPLRNEVMDWFLNRTRLRFGGGTLTRDQGLRPALHALKQGQTFHYSPDEDLGAEQSVFVPFFGVPAATLPTLGRIAQSADAVVIPTFVRVRRFGGYDVILAEPMENYPTGDEIEDAARMNRAIEIGVREMPEQYMWTFKLFKTRPDHGASPYA
jgi:lipid A biosynthesis (KDO)2-(lauroyl)-lipid IVA acyltransferase